MSFRDRYHATLVSGVVVAMLICNPAKAADFVYGWAQNISARPAYAAAPSYLFNATGQGRVRQTLTTSPGIYSVDVYNLVDDPFVGSMTTAYGSANTSCVAHTSGLSRIGVSCYDPAGNHQQSKFTFMAVRPAESDLGKYAYAWVSSYSLERGEVYVTQSFPNEYIGGSAMAVSRQSKGTYRVGLGSLARTANTILVNATSGIFLLRRCNPHNWNSGSVTIKCYDKDGQLADAPFTVMSFSKEMDGVSFLWNGQSTGGVPYAGYAHASDGSAQNVERTAAGKYRVSLGPEADIGGHVQASMYAGKGHCNVVNWSGGVANIACYDFHGRPKDARFTVLALKRQQDVLFELPDGVTTVPPPLRPEWLIRRSVD